MKPTLETSDNDAINSLFLSHTGVDINSLLTPISQEQPSGESLKSNGVYTAIKLARSSDDPNLPMGEWEHDLKTADWNEVTSLAVNALSARTKDLQIAIWLLEAQIHQYGFSGIAPAMQLLSELTQLFWDDIYPQIDDGDMGYRTNLIEWLNEKLLPAISQLPITGSRSEKQYSWSDWEMAIKIEQFPSDKKKKENSEYVSSQTIMHAIIATPISFYQNFYRYCSDAIISIEKYSALIDHFCGQESPSLSSLQNLLLEIRETLAAQVKHRGLFSNASESQDNNSPDSNPPGNSESQQSQGNQNNNNNNYPVNSREKAYHQLAQAAEYLKQDDPHSPVPYLIFKAINWGQLNTAELYQELFVEYQGQLNIFEILGLELEKK